MRYRNPNPRAALCLKRDAYFSQIHRITGISLIIEGCQYKVEQNVAQSHIYIIMKLYNIMEGRLTIRKTVTNYTCNNLWHLIIEITPSGYC